MTEIKLIKRYPHSRTEDIVDAYMRGWNDALDAVQNGKFHITERNETESECNTCKYAEDADEHCELCGIADINNYEPKADRKTEPQCDAEEVAKDINRRVDMVKKEWNARHIQDEPQTERSE